MFARLAAMRVQCHVFEQKLQELLAQTRRDVLSDEPIPVVDPMQAGQRSPVPQPPTSPMPHRPAEPAYQAPPPPTGFSWTDLNPPRGFQTPAPDGAPRLPPPPKKSPADVRAELVRHIDDMRAIAIHLNNCSHLLLAIADLVESGLMRILLRRRPSR